MAAKSLQEVLGRVSDEQARLIWTLISGAVEDADEDDEDPMKTLRPVLAACDEAVAGEANDE